MSPRPSLPSTSKTTRNLLRSFKACRCLADSYQPSLARPRLPPPFSSPSSSSSSSSTYYSLPTRTYSTLLSNRNPSPSSSSSSSSPSPITSSRNARPPCNLQPRSTHPLSRDLSISVTTKRPASQVRTSSKEGGRENQEARKDSTSTLRSPSSSVHPNEIEHFSKLSSEWWDEHGEFGLLHSMNKVRIQFIREKLEEVKGYESAFREVHGRSLDPHLNGGEKEGQEEKKTRFLEGLKVLDVGCGGGLLSESLTRLGAKTTGLDASPSNIKIASIHSSKDPELAGGLEYIHSTAEELVRLSDSKGSYDLVLAMEVIEHVKGPGEFLTTLDSLLKPGGHLFLSTISRTNLSWFLTILMAERLLRFVTPGTHTHEQYINPEELVEFVNVQLGWKAGWSTFESREAISLPERIKIETRGTAYLPWKSSWELLGKDSFYPDTKACNYFFWARKPF